MSSHESLGPKLTSLVPPLRPIRPARASSLRDGSARVPHGRYDQRSVNTRLPPGGDLATSPRDAVRAKLEKRLERTRHLLRGRIDLVEAERLHEEQQQIVAAIAGDSEPSGTVAVTDPMGDGEQRILATVNRAVDVLEQDRSRKLISEAAYRTGRLLQGVLEYSRRIGGSNWTGACRKDPGEVRDTHAQRMIDDGRLAERYKARMRDRLGMGDTRLLTRIVGDGLSFAECACLVGKSGERGQRYIAARYRDALEELAEAWTAKGRVVPPTDDKHLAAAADVAVRQKAALAGGTTLERLKGELMVLQRKRPRDLTREEAVEMVEISRRIEALQSGI